jgi:deazaflavin-dependent oxidoreductase (nitroreductase family)
MARVNAHFTNRVLGRFATRVPGFGVVVHHGRRSGRAYRTPVNVFAAPGGYVVALTYGAGSGWVRNVLAEGECELETRGRRVRLTAPHLFHDERRRPVPPPVRIALRILRVADFMKLSAHAHPPTGGQSTE